VVKRRGAKSLPRYHSYPSARIYAVNAIVTEGLNRDRIEPPQPTVYS